MNELRILFLLLALALSSACTKKSSDNKCPCKVRLLHMSSDGSYNFQDTYLSTLTNIDSVSSSIIRVSINPGVQAFGNVPVAQYMFTRDHVLVPKTTETSELFSLYKNMEDLYKFDVEIGVDKLLTYPQTISLQTNANTSSSTNNAYYIPDFDSIVVLKFSGNKKPVPLSINPGLIAHEHFHAIFEHIMRLYKKTDLKVVERKDGKLSLLDQVHGVPKNLSQAGGYNYLMLSSLNEGLADFWAYIFTGKRDSFSDTLLENVVGDRAIYEKVEPMPDQNIMNNIFNYKMFVRESGSSVDDVRPIHQNIYFYAAHFSHFLKTVSDKLFNIEDPRTIPEKKELAKWVIDSLQRLKSRLDSKNSGDVFLPQDFVASFIPENFEPKKNPEICSAIQIYLVNYDTTTVCK